jgi:hypothetical protein
MNTHFALLAGLALAACATDDPPPGPQPTPNDQLSVAALPLEVQTRLVRAVMYDAIVAEWIGSTLRHHAPSCATVDSENGTVTLASPCSMAAGSALDGKLVVLDAFGGVPSYRFEHLRIFGETTDDMVIVDGVLDFENTPPTYHRTIHLDLEMTRSGIAVHTSITATDGVIAEGSFVEYKGKRARVTGDLRTGIELIGNDRYSYQPYGACGMDSLRQQICVRSPTPSRFKRGAVRQLSLSCVNGDGEVRVETTSPARVHASLGGGSYTLSYATSDPASGNYVFTASGGSCVTSPRDYTVSQNDGSFRAELMALPRVTWAH